MDEIDWSIYAEGDGPLDDPATNELVDEDYDESDLDAALDGLQ